MKTLSLSIWLVLGATASAGADGNRPLQLAVHGAVDGEALRASIAAELGIDAELVAGTCERPCLEVAIARSHEAVVSFTPEAGGLRQRAIALADDAAQSRQLITWLAGNLVRDEALDLLPAAPAPAVDTVPVVPPPALGVAATSASTAPAPIATFSLSALHLVAPILDATVELRVGDRIGIAAIGEVGRTSSCGPGDGYLARKLGACSGPPAGVSGAGAKLAYYFGRGFAGLHTGVELDYQRISLVAMDSSQAIAALAGSDTSVATFVGYKLIARGGLTLGLQGGVAVHAFTGQVQTGASAMPTRSTSVSPLVRFDVGWSL